MQAIQIANEEDDKKIYYLYDRKDGDKTTKIYVDCFFYNKITLGVEVEIYKYEKRIFRTKLQIHKINYLNNLYEIAEESEEKIIYYINDMLIIYDSYIRQINTLFKDTMRDKCIYNIIFNKSNLDRLHEHIIEEIIYKSNIIDDILNNYIFII